MFFFLFLPFSCAGGQTSIVQKKRKGRIPHLFIEFSMILNTQHELDKVQRHISLTSEFPLLIGDE
jgi:hypothetical protein